MSLEMSPGNAARDHSRFDEAQETLRAVGSGEVDAFVISDRSGDRVCTLGGADGPYRAMVECMSEGALTVTAVGLILFSNERFASLVQQPSVNRPGDGGPRGAQKRQVIFA
jgi:hypothetical protein